MAFIVIGVVGLVIASILTNAKLKQFGLDPEHLKMVTGTGIVPSWVSLINLLSWVLVAVGIFLLLFK